MSRQATLTREALHGKRPDVRTPERDQIFFAVYPTFIPVNEIIRRLNALDGPAIETVDIRPWAMTLNVRRPPYGGLTSTLAKIRTPERDAQVRRLGPTMASDDEIIAAVNALPGHFALTRNYICTYLAALNIYRSEEYRRARLARNLAFETPHPPAGEVLGTEAIDYEVAAAWGRRMRIGVCNDRDETMARINEKRGEYHLPQWTLRRRAQELQLT
jgi:hypothetical protein